MSIRPQLATLLNDAAGAWWQRSEAERRKTRIEVLQRLVSLVAAAARDDSEALQDLVPAIHVLVEFSRAPEAAARKRISDALAKVTDEAWSEAFAGLLFSGKRIEFDDDPRCSSMIRWRTFLDYHAASYGINRKDDEAVEAFWKRLAAGREEVPVNEVHFDGYQGVVWVTDRQSLITSCSERGGAFDGSKAYELLALDWSEAWDDLEGAGDDEVGVARAVLVSCPAGRRSAAESGVRMPTAFDAWENFLFVPGDHDVTGPWPAVGSWTVVPVSGDRGLPEAVHGPIDASPNESVPAEPAGTVRSAPGGIRVDECGKIVAERALELLREVAVP